MKKKFVFLIGACHTQEDIMALRRYQSELKKVSAPVMNILDFATEGNDAPGFEEVAQMKEFIDRYTSSVVVMSPKSEMVMILLEHTKERGIQFVNYLDIDLTAPMKRKSWLDKLNDFLRPWFTNPMKQPQAN